MPRPTERKAKPKPKPRTAKQALVGQKAAMKRASVRQAQARAAKRKGK
jgi:hypothetical protein